MRKLWTEDEITYITNQIGNLSVKALAEDLGKTPEAVNLKLKRLGITSTREQVGDLTVGDLADILKVDRGTVRNWIKSHGLKSKNKVTKIERSFSFIRLDDFWEWASQHKDWIDWKKVSYNSLPPEPEWVNKRRRGNPSLHKKEYNVWTTKEEHFLIQLVKRGKNKTDIAKELGRTLISVERKLNRLKIKQ